MVEDRFEAFVESWIESPQLWRVAVACRDSCLLRVDGLVLAHLYFEVGKKMFLGDGKSVMLR